MKKNKERKTHLFHIKYIEINFFYDLDHKAHICKDVPIKECAVIAKDISEARKYLRIKKNEVLSYETIDNYLPTSETIRQFYSNT